VKLRDMVMDDVPAVMALERDLFPDDAWTPDMFTSDLRKPGLRTRYLVAQDQTTIIGYIGMLFPGGDEADVLTVAVAQAHWGEGIGTALLEALFSEATSRRCTQVFLEVRADNPRAQNLYTRHGFTEVGVRKGYYQPSGADAIVMRKDLNQ
jgi:[ribosomal protein S18]-alanine N-acetyltransferase